MNVVHLTYASYTRSWQVDTLDQPMSNTTAFVSELIRAANEVEKLGDFEQRRMLERAAVMIREMRQIAGIPNSHTIADGLIDLQAAAIALGRGQRTPNEIKADMLAAAGMIRDLHIVLDTETKIQIGK